MAVDTRIVAECPRGFSGEMKDEFLMENSRLEAIFANYLVVIAHHSESVREVDTDSWGSVRLRGAFIEQEIPSDIHFGRRQEPTGRPGSNEYT